MLSVTELSEQVSKDSALAEKNKENHDESVSNVGTPLQTDRWIYRIVVGALALALVSSIGGAVWLQSNDKDIPEILIGLGHRLSSLEKAFLPLICPRFRLAVV